ncbi:MAG TPA: hypothetical protein VGD72_13275 [Mycobacteriales bacterium]
MTSMSALSSPPVPEQLHALDALGLELRLTEPGKVVSVYRTSVDVTQAVTALARTGRQALPQLGWTLEFSPTETVLILAGPQEALAALGFTADYTAEA